MAFPSQDPTAMQDQTRVFFNQMYDPNEKQYEVSEQSTALVRYAPDFRTDPFYHKVLQHMQRGEWQQSVLLLNALTEKYPRALELEWLMQDALVRSEVEQNWGNKVKGRSGASMDMMRMISRVGAVALIAALVLGGTLYFMRFKRDRDTVAERLALLNQAQTAMADAKYLDALTAYEQLLVRDAEDRDAQAGKQEAEGQIALAAEYEKAMAAYTANDFTSALALFSALNQRMPGYKDVAQIMEKIQSGLNAATLFDTAETAFKAQKWQEAITQFEALREVNSSYETETVTERLVESYTTLGVESVGQRPAIDDDLSTVEDMFRKVLRLKTGDETARTESGLLETYRLGVRALSQNNLDQAVTNFSSVYQSRSTYLGGLLAEQLYNTYLALGDRAQVAGDNVKALEYYRLAMEVSVTDKSQAIQMVTKVSIALQPTPTPTPEPTPKPVKAQPAYAGGGGGGAAVVDSGPVVNTQPLTAYRGWILFLRDGAYYIMRPDGSSQQVAPQEASQKFEEQYKLGQWSPDGKTRAYVDKNADGSDDANIWKLRADLPENWNRNFMINDFPRLQYDPTWSPNGQWIAFVSNHTGSDEVWIMDTEGGNVRQLTKNTWEWDKHPVWSPDSSRIIFFSNRSGRNQIWAMNVDGSGQVNISNSSTNDDYPLLIK